MESKARQSNRAPKIGSDENVPAERANFLRFLISMTFLFSNFNADLKEHLVSYMHFDIKKFVSISQDLIEY